MSTTLYLSRHGQTTWHLENRYCGSSDVDLSTVGREQATRLGLWAARQQLEALYVSPIRRARETAAPVAASTGLPPVLVPGLVETDFGIAEGRTLAELRAERPGVVEAFEGDPIGGVFPGAEDPAAAAWRGLAALRAISGAHPDGRVLVVAHNTLLRLTLCLALGIPLSFYRQVLPLWENGTLSTVRISPDGTLALLSYNVPLP